MDASYEEVIYVEEPSGESGDEEGSGSLEENKIEKAGSSKNQAWTHVHSVLSDAALQRWFEEQEEKHDIKLIKHRSTRHSQGVKNYYRCAGFGCEVQYEVFYANTSDDIAVSNNGKEHEHKENPHKRRGLSDRVKKKVMALFRSGEHNTTRMEEHLRRAGYTGFTHRQLQYCMLKLRARARDEEAVQSYSSLSLWGAARRRDSELTTRLENDSDHYLGASSPPASAGSECDSPPSSPGSECDSPPSSPGSDSAAKRRRTGPAPASAARQSSKRARLKMDEETLRRLVASSLEARRRSYSPYSQFPVGAALLCDDGELVTGCNVENASYGLTNCAERTAVFRAVAEGRRRFSAVAIAAEMGDTFVGPCGACRQVLAEFNATMPVILAKPNGETKITNMKDLLPMAFLPEDVPFKKE